MLSTVHDVIFKTRIRDESIGGENPFRWQDASTDDIFKGNKVVVLALPGAYKPICSFWLANSSLAGLAFIINVSGVVRPKFRVVKPI
jgi:peroxiredoxin